jgi:simple sugar transport system ATP-binding protein
VIFISHKLHEILAISDRVAILRRGAIVGEVQTSDADRSLLAEMMVGEKVARPKPRALAYGAPILRLSNISIADVHSGAGLRGVDLTVNAHEIIGIVGVAGNGQSALADLLSGLLQPDAGSVELLGENLEAISASDMVRRGVGRIPEDRHKSGIVGEMQIWENLISEQLRSPDFSRLINKSRALERAKSLIEQFDIRCEGPEAETKLLSGGNIQKLILARTLAPDPSFILANQPVRGLDEGAIAYVQTQLLEARDRGAGILLISEDLDELLSLSDRIAVMFRGTLSESFKNGSKTVAEMGLMMAGHAVVETVN